MSGGAGRVPGLGSQVCTHFPPCTPPHSPRKLQHRNLVRLLGVILHHGLYIVMEHVSKVWGGGGAVSKVWGGGSKVGAGGWAKGGSTALRPPGPSPQTGQPGELPAHAGPRARERTSAPAVFSVSDIPSRKVGPKVEGETEV